MMKLILALLAVLYCLVGVQGQVELTASTFESKIAQKDTFVKFYAPWCGHCKRLAPTWTELGTKYSNNKDVQIAKLDCTQHRDLCSKNGVRGYPTLKFFKAGDSEGEKYQGARSIEAFSNFLDEKQGQ